MHKTLTALAAALLWSGGALAQGTAGGVKRPDPLDAAAATAPLVHRSAFSGYRKMTADTSPRAWREANDGVERIGGWRAYAREAQASQAPAPPASAPAAKH
ncbi:MAG: hypothetical protein OEU94_15645 [Aquincola sp.]|nr:hypothetical protein [Aquincola sp.]MDH4290590.1 hypothetical protein [Aquincola sp.]